jgi:hypothetical protein
VAKFWPYTSIHSDYGRNSNLCAHIWWEIAVEAHFQQQFQMDYSKHIFKALKLVENLYKKRRWNSKFKHYLCVKMNDFQKTWTSGTPFWKSIEIVPTSTKCNPYSIFFGWIWSTSPVSITADNSTSSDALSGSSAGLVKVKKNQIEHLMRWNYLQWSKLVMLIISSQRIWNRDYTWWMLVQFQWIFKKEYHLFMSSENHSFLHTSNV